MSCQENCLNCAYLFRQQSYWHNLFPASEKSYWRYEKDVLSTEQRIQISQNDFSFLGAKKKELEEFKKKVEAKKSENEKAIEKAKSALPTNLQLQLHLHLFQPKKTIFDEAKDLGISEEEIRAHVEEHIPADDEIKCYMKQWQKSVDPTMKFLQQFSCNHFFKFDSAMHSNVALDGIEKSHIRQIEFMNAKTAKNSLSIAKISLCVSIPLIVISIIIASIFGINDYLGDREWQNHQIQFLKENNSSILKNNELLKQIKEELIQFNHGSHTEHSKLHELYKELVHDAKKK